MWAKNDVHALASELWAWLAEYLLCARDGSAGSGRESIEEIAKNWKQIKDQGKRKKKNNQVTIRDPRGGGEKAVKVSSSVAL